jgi:hypothetical protein
MFLAARMLARKRVLRLFRASNAARNAHASSSWSRLRETVVKSATS